jgi:hypothetical protein
MLDTPAELDVVLKFTGQLECRDIDGNLLKVIEISGTSPLSDFASPVQLQKEDSNG